MKTLKRVGSSVSSVCDTLDNGLQAINSLTKIADAVLTTVFIDILNDMHSNQEESGISLEELKSTAEKSKSIRNIW